VTLKRLSLSNQADVRPLPAAAAVVGREPRVLDRRGRAQTRLRAELLRNLIRKDLKVKYKGSTLGFAWSLANPLLLLAVYYVVFQIILPGRVPYFAVYLMSGLLIWNAFMSSVSAACGSVVYNSNLVKKVRFPLPVLPLSAVGFALVHFVLQLGVLFVVVAALRYNFIGLQLLLLFPAFAVAMVFTVGLALLVAALNTRYRDTQHLLDVALIAWFWLNPIVYDAGLIRAHLHAWTWVYFLNPMATVAATFQRAIYKKPYATVNGTRELILANPGYLWYLQELAIVGVLSLGVLWLGYRVFDRMQADFAEDL
jgi:ABC-2 type transport system permease protein